MPVKGNHFIVLLIDFYIRTRGYMLTVRREDTDSVSGHTAH